MLECLPRKFGRWPIPSATELGELLMAMLSADNSVAYIDDRVPVIDTLHADMRAKASMTG